MKKILLTLLLAFIFVTPLLSFFAQKSYAQTATPTPTTTTTPPCNDPSNTSCYTQGQFKVGDWITDPDVTFVGKSAARSGQFLDWTLKNYQWICVKTEADGITCDNSNNPLSQFWLFVVTHVVAPIFLLVVIVTAFILIITRGRNLTLKKFIPRFMGIVILVALSFSLFSFVYQTGDIIQGFFLTNPDFKPPPQQINVKEDAAPEEYNNPYINQRNLLFVGFNYNAFEGIRKFGDQFDESVFVTLLLTKLTAITYYTMTGILLIRKIILWFFIIVSPILPLLFFYSPVRNTAKIWIGELLRWLLYAPLFAMLLAGLVTLWGTKASPTNHFDPKTQSPVPLSFSRGKESDAAYADTNFPTAVNILLGGPGETVCYTPGTCSNSVNYIDTFALYAVSLLMLWVVILLPFVLLQIFLDYVNNINWNESWLNKQVLNTQQLFGRGNPNSPVSPIPPSPIRSTGVARQIPLERGAAASIGESAHAQISRPVQADAEVLRLTNLSVPTMRDIARYETSRISTNTTSRQEVTTVKETLERIANTNSTSSTIEKEHFERVKEKLFQESQQGNITATSILKAANSFTPNAVPNATKQVQTVIEQIANPGKVVNSVDKARYTELQQTIVREQQHGNPLAAQIVAAQRSGNITQVEEVKEKLQIAQKQGDKLATQVLSEVKKEEEHAKAIAPAFPTSNRVQQVNLDDYEAVKKMWQENYKKLDVPADLAAKGVDRRSWISDDIKSISQAITLLSNIDQTKVSEGMKMVSTILPFLLIGGFSQNEVVAYLKAKQEAAKSVLEDVNEKDEEEDTLMDAKTQQAEKPQEMHLEEQQEFTDDDKTDGSSQNNPPKE